MSPFEDQLREALRRKEPPAGFAERVIALTAKRPTWRERFLSPLLTPRLAFATLAIAALIAGGVQYQRYQRAVELARAEQAKRQVMTAMRIAGSKLNYVQHKLDSLRDGRADHTEN